MVWRTGGFSLMRNNSLNWRVVVGQESAVGKAILSIVYLLTGLLLLQSCQENVSPWVWRCGSSMGWRKNDR